MSNQIEGRCICGAVRFIATGEPAEVSWCHCQSCRRHTPLLSHVAFRRDAYAVTEGEITKFNSSPGRLRGFCAHCGSTMSAAKIGHGEPFPMDSRSRSCSFARLLLTMVVVGCSGPKAFSQIASARSPSARAPRRSPWT
jgi:hypothetical protein